MHTLMSRLMCAFLTLTGMGLAQREVYINQVLIPEPEVQALESSYFIKIPAGFYWYDPGSGLVGVEGNPPSGRIMLGLDLGGRIS